MPAPSVAGSPGQPTSSTAAVSLSDAGLLVVLLLVDSLHLVFARALQPHLNPVLSATLVLWVATLQVGTFGVVRNRIDLAAIGRNIWFLLAIGILVGGSTALGYMAVGYIDPGTASMLSRTTTIFSIGLGVWWLHERLRRRQAIGAIFALVGVAIITFQPGDVVQLGSMLIIVGSLMYAAHAALVKRYGQGMDFLTFFFGRLLFTALSLSLFALIWSPITAPSPIAWALLIITGTVDVVISRTLYYLALRRLTVSLHAIILTLSPVATILWSLLFFGAFPTVQQLLGGLIVMVGVALAAIRRTS